MRKLLIILACLFALVGCTTVAPIDTSKTDGAYVDVIDAQTEVIISGKDVESIIEGIKVITDDAKVSGEIPKDKTVTLIQYVDRSAAQIKAHNETVKVLSGKISTLEKSRIDDNKKSSGIISGLQKDLDKAKAKAGIYFKWAAIASIIAIGLAAIMFLPKLLKLV